MSFQSDLLRWYHADQRPLPWRKTRDPYKILLSEVMLQQTQVATVIPFYRRFLETFPTFQALASAPLNQVLKLWEGLGYYSRARNLHALAKAVAALPKQTLPRDHKALMALPGIGPYTAGAVMSIAFEKDFPVVDGNVQRVFARYFGIAGDLRDPSTIKQMWVLAAKLLPRGRARHYNQALMELGATICAPKNPRCLLCPVSAKCFACLKGRQVSLPFKSKKAPIPHKHIGAGVIWKGGEILIGQRPAKGLLGGLWEFPGGKQEPGETLQETVRREIKEELDISVKVGEKLATVDHAYTHFKITLHVYHCHYVSGNPKAIGVDAWQWVKPEELRRFAFPGANQPVISSLLRNNPRKIEPLQGMLGDHVRKRTPARRVPPR